MADPAPDEPAQDDLERARRRHPAERRTSRWSGLLLLLIIPHAAFGYALVDLAPGPGWVRTTHFVFAPFMLALAVLLVNSVRRLPWRRRRERGLLLLAVLVVLLSGFQLLSGLWMRWRLPGAADLWLVHVGAGIVNTLVVAMAHVVAILPSILLSAKREHAELGAKRRR